MIDTAALRLQIERTIRATGGDPLRKAIENYTKKALADEIRNRVIPDIEAEAERIDVNIEELVEEEARKQTPFIDSAIRASITADTTPESIFERDIMPDYPLLEEQIMEATGDGSLQNDIVQDVLRDFPPNDLTVCSIKVPMSTMKLSEATVVDTVGKVRVKLIKEYAPGKMEAKYSDYDVLIWTEPVVSGDRSSSGGGGDTDTIIDQTDGSVSILFHFKNKTNNEAPLHVIMCLSRNRKKPLSKLSYYDVSKAFGKIYGGEVKGCVIRVPVDPREVVENITTKPANLPLEELEEDRNGEWKKADKEHTLVNNSEPHDSLGVLLFIVRINDGSG